MAKVYCRPVVIDLHLVLCKLDGDQVSLVRIPMVALLSSLNPVDLVRLETEGFSEVSVEEFANLAEKNASKESYNDFIKNWEKVYA